ncbi:hypothetical protein AB0L82_35380 [Nocardia sp. NPDC052001]|uniref:hypothetical protein n=1 Tax=Nocardia sp. NPDC052001 TaxID=3154853 RepID=UPI003433A392
MTSSEHSGPDAPFTPAKFMLAMRRFHQRSGLTAGQIAVSSGLPRSTAYRFTHPENITLPKSRDQVLQFLQACHTPASQIRTMLRLWDLLAGGIRPDEPARAVTFGTGGQMEFMVAPEIPEDLPHPDSHVGDLLKQLVVRGQRLRYTTDSTPERGMVVELGTPTEHGCLACAGTGNIAALEAMMPTRVGLLRRMSWQPPVLALLLLTLLVYPVITQLVFDYSVRVAVFPILIVGIGLLVLLSVSLQQFKTWVITPTRLIAMTVASMGAGTLSWLATSTPMMGLLSGFSVCALAPIWLSFTQLPGLCTTARGVFVLLSAGWFGAVLGCTASLVDMPIPGAVLTGIAGTAVSIMLLSSRLLPSPTEESGVPQNTPEPSSGT